MKYRIVSVGRIREPYVIAAITDFRTRLAKYETVEEIEVAQSHGSDPHRAVADEGERILRVLAPGETLWLLERTGAALTSVELSQRLRAAADRGTQSIAFAIAGTYGASDALLARADVTWSLSSLTFLHEWAKMLLFEQLYRAAKIARNEPYHH